MRHLPNSSPFRSLVRRIGIVVATLAMPAGLLIAATAPSPVTPASGASLLTRMNRNFDRTSLGRAGTLAQEPAVPAPVPSLDFATALREGFAVKGSDLYRYDCRACHGPAGAGVPPEIRPLTPAVQATSLELQQRVKEQESTDRKTAEVERLASIAERAIEHRLAGGGAVMPAMAHLDPQEQAALLSYVERLARVPDPAHSDATLPRTAVEVGEQIVKGTCQICHDATESAGAARITDRQIPQLADFPHAYGLLAFLEKARHGQPVELGRGRMPQLTYLSDAELASVYLYLAAYPPR